MFTMKTRFVVSISIPIVSYTGEHVFEVKFLFDKSPSREDVIDVVTSWEETSDSPYHEESVEVISRLLDSINQVDEWVMLSEYLIHYDTQVTLTLSDGKEYLAPFSWKREIVYSI